MQLRPKPVCVECDAGDAKIVALFTREHYCGRYCFAEGSIKYARLIIRFTEEEGYEQG